MSISESDLMGVIRRVGHLGRPEAKGVMGRNRTVIRMLLKRGVKPEQIEAAIYGVRQMVTCGEVKWIPPGVKFSMLALVKARSGVRPLFGLAVDAYYRAQEGRRDRARPRTDPVPVSEVLDEILASVSARMQP